MRIAAPGTEGGTNFMMVVSYWEQGLRAARLWPAARRPLPSKPVVSSSGSSERHPARTAAGAAGMWKKQYFLIHMENAAKRFESVVGEKETLAGPDRHDARSS